MTAELDAALRELRAAVLWRLACRRGWAVSREEVAALVAAHGDREIVARLAARAASWPAALLRPWQKLRMRLRRLRPAGERTLRRGLEALRRSWRSPRAEARPARRMRRPQRPSPSGRR